MSEIEKLLCTRQGAYIEDELGRKWWSEIVLNMVQSQKDAMTKMERLIYESDRAVRERNLALAKADQLREALALTEVEVSLSRTWCRLCRTESFSRDRSRDIHPHARECILYDEGMT